MNEKKKLHPFKLILALLFLAALGLVLFSIFIYKPKLTEEKINSIVLEINSIISDTSELNSSISDYDITHQFENSKKIKGIKIPFTTNQITFKYNGKVKAGIDLNKIKVKATNDSIIIVLPEPEIFSNELDNESLQVYDEKKGLFNRFDIEDYNDLTAELKKIGEEDAIKNGILNDASKSAKKQLESLLSGVCKKNHLSLVIIDNSEDTEDLESSENSEE